jgi:hypothetical protein
MRVKKAQVGKAVAKKKAAVDSVRSEMFPDKMIPKSAVRKGSYITETKKVVAKKKMKSGGSLKPVGADQKGLAKLPTAVRNKMGYQKDGGKMMKAKSGASLSPSKQNVSDELGGYKKTIGKNYSAKAMYGASMMKMGGKAAKQAAIAIAMKKEGKTPKKKMQYGGAAASMAPKKAMGGMKMMKGGGKCKYGC